MQDSAGAPPRPAARPVLVTGAAGFAGCHVARALRARGDAVVGADSFSPFTPRKLQDARLAHAAEGPGPPLRFRRADLADRAACADLFARENPGRVVHLAGQASVRHALKDPHAYADANLTAFLNVLEGCRAAGVEHLVYASTSAVYGANRKLPFAVGDAVDHPISLYAATKKAGELMAHAYASTHRLPVTGLRFFTVYGPFGRPDMAPWLFTKAILEGRPIRLFNAGLMRRDFTYVDDVVEGVLRVLDRPAAPNPAWDPLRPDPATSAAPYRLYNVGGGAPVPLLDFVAALERLLGREAIREMAPLPPGEVLETVADTTALERDLGFTPGTPLEVGLGRFVDWYRAFHGA